ncbi:MAG: cytochrome P450 [Actinomadura rubrobrunea]|nr:cytochrome P450 [Actinomadura rubrobrunea]
MTDVTYPLARRRALDPPAEAAELARRAPIHRMVYADGHRGWLVTGFAAARAVLADPRFSNRPERMHPPVSGRFGELLRDPEFQAPPGFFLRLDPPDHTRFRKLLTGQFTVRRMKMLEPRIEEICGGFLDAMQAAGPPADLVEMFALPVPSMVICELLGVPYEDRDRFQRDSRTLLSLHTSADEARAAMRRTLDYMAELVRRKRVEPGDDLLSGLIETGELKHDELAGVAMLLLIAGHETTANMLGLGTYALLTHPDQLAAMRAGPATVDGAVEELLRHLTIVHIGPTRTALEDVELAGRTIKAGESVTLDLRVANRDPSRFPDGDRLDLTRGSAGHLAFGHGVHQCLGQQLARAEMRIAYPALLRRFPRLRLAVPADDVPMRTDMAIYGVHRLPVTW